MSDPYFSIVDLPVVPLGLREHYQDIIAKTNTFVPGKGVTEMNYATFAVNEDLKEWIQDLFDYPVDVNYQLIRVGLKIHKDRAAIYKYNYYITTGGPDSQILWRTKDDPDTIYAALDAQPNTWYKLWVEHHHSVCNVTSPRLSICVVPSHEGSMKENKLDQNYRS